MYNVVTEFSGVGSKPSYRRIRSFSSTDNFDVELLDSLLNVLPKISVPIELSPDLAVVI